MITKNELENLYNNHSTKYCIEYLKISRWKFYDLLNEYNIKIKPQKQNQINKEVLIDMYVNKNLDIKDISKQLNISSVYFYKVLEKNKISKRKNIKTNKHISKELIKEVYNESKNYIEASKKLNVSYSWFGRHMKKFGLKARKPQKGQSKIVRNKGCTIDEEGRKSIFMPSHNLSIGNYVANSILLMENHIGRKLNKGEIVHHIDLDCSNDNINNLMLLKSRSEYSLIHSKIYNKGKSNFVEEKNGIC